MTLRLPMLALRSLWGNRGAQPVIHRVPEAVRHGLPAWRDRARVGMSASCSSAPKDALVTELALARHAETRACELARGIRTLVQWLSHDVLALAGPKLATRAGQ